MNMQYGQGSARQLVSSPQGVSWGSSQAKGLHHLKACSLPHLAIPAHRWLGSYIGLSARTPAHGHSLWSGLPHSMALGSKGPKTESQVKLQNPILQVLSITFCSPEAYHLSHTDSRRRIRLCLLLGRASKNLPCV